MVIFLDLTATLPAPGTCPACDQPMDDTRCAIEDGGVVVPEAAARTGIQAVWWVACRGRPDPGREVPCPCCVGHPGRRHPHGEGG